ncbi:MAG: ASCH domain-containing protein [Dongiaceae bacterium]
MALHSKRTAAVEAFWREAVAATSELNPDTEFAVWSFGDNQELCDHVLAETLAGRNRGTASLKGDYEGERGRLPQVGDVAIVTDWAGAPRAVLVTRRIDIRRYADIDEDFARAEDYVTDPLNEWREVHWAYFSRCCAELGRVASLDMPIVCERFELVYPD